MAADNGGGCQSAEARACSDDIEPPDDAIAGLVPAIPIQKRGAFTIGMAGTSPAMTIPCERDAV
jgi:hypothetical protein